jgi:VIT1/CCC1 family predicted Fe2+/Mn2+ transporter
VTSSTAPITGLAGLLASFLLFAAGAAIPVLPYLLASGASRSASAA